MGLDLTTTTKTGWRAQYAAAEWISGGNWGDRALDGGSDPMHAIACFKLDPSGTFTSFSNTALFTYGTGGPYFGIFPGLNFAVLSMTVGGSNRSVILNFSSFTKHTTVGSLATANGYLYMGISYTDSSTAPVGLMGWIDEDDDSEVITGNFSGSGTLPSAAGSFQVGTTSGIVPFDAQYLFTCMQLGSLSSTDFGNMIDDNAPWSALTRTDGSWGGSSNQCFAWGLRQPRGISFGDTSKVAGVEFDDGDEIALLRYAASGDRIAIPDPANVTITNTGGSGAVNLSDNLACFPITAIETAGDGTLSRSDHAAMSPWLARLLDRKPQRQYGLLFVGGQNCFSDVGDLSHDDGLAISTNPATPDATAYPGARAAIPQDMSGGAAALLGARVVGTLVTTFPNAAYTSGTSDRQTRVMMDWGNTSAGSADGLIRKATDSSIEKNWARFTLGTDNNSGVGEPILIQDGDECEIVFHPPEQPGFEAAEATYMALLFLEHGDSVDLAVASIADAGDSGKPLADASSPDYTGTGPSYRRAATVRGYIDDSADINSTATSLTSYTLDTDEIHGIEPEVGDVWNMQWDSGDCAVSVVTAYDPDTGVVSLDWAPASASIPTGSFERASWGKARYRWHIVPHRDLGHRELWRGATISGTKNGSGRAPQVLCAAVAAYQNEPGWVVGSIGSPVGWDTYTDRMSNTAHGDGDDSYAVQFMRALGMHINVWMTSADGTSTIGEVRVAIEELIDKIPQNDHVVISDPTTPSDALDDDMQTAYRDIAETIGTEKTVPWSKGYGLIGSGAYQQFVGFRGPDRRLSGLGAREYLNAVLEQMAASISERRIEPVSAPANSVGFARRRLPTSAAFASSLGLVNTMLSQPEDPSSEPDTEL